MFQSKCTLYLVCWCLLTLGNVYACSNTEQTVGDVVQDAMLGSIDAEIGDTELDAMDLSAELDQSSQEQCVLDQGWIDLPIRVHLIKSAISNLNATLSVEDVVPLFTQVQPFWTQACIRLVIESVVENQVNQEQEEAYRQTLALAPSGATFRAMMLEVMPKSNLLRPGWNVMIFHSFPQFSSGVYLSEIPSVLFAQNLPEPAGGAPNPPVILAHEIGHSLGLLHFEGINPERNLMNVDVMQNRETSVELTDEQIEQARSQAANGDTFIP